MHKIKTFILVIFLSAFAVHTVSADQTERIESFHSDINIQSNSQVEVREKIQYFFPSPRHGIIRHIPVKYAVKRAESLTGDYNIYLTLLSVNIEREDGKIEAVPYQKEEKSGNVNIKIGDSQKEVSGNITYLINYQMARAINFSPAENENQDEFYWNVTGTGWEVPIAKSSAEIHFPADIDPGTWKFACFTGSLGSEQKECAEEASNSRSVIFNSRWELPAKEGLTVVAGFPKDVVTPPSMSDNLYLTLQHDLFVYLFLLIPIAVFVALFIIWFLKGRDPEGKGTIIPFYAAPDGLTPVELGTLIDEKADTKDVSSSIIDLAVRGYLKIREVENKSLFGIFKNKPDYEILLLKSDNLIPESEKKIFNTVFEIKSGSSSETISELSQREKKVKLSDLQNTFPAALGDIKENIYGGLVQKGYFPKSPERVRNTYFFAGAIVGFLGIILFINDLGVIGAGSMFLTGAMIAIFGIFMPRKTAKGVSVYEKILGLKEYLTVAEEDRIKFHNAPAKKPEVFEKLLPYAMVLGVEKEWAKQFEGIYANPPAWYAGSSLTNFNTLYLVTSLSRFSNTANAAMGIKFEGGGAAGGMSGFGGGGFSGGGFGGGGGSSW